MMAAKLNGRDSGNDDRLEDDARESSVGRSSKAGRDKDGRLTE